MRVTRISGCTGPPGTPPPRCAEFPPAASDPDGQSRARGSGGRADPPGHSPIGPRPDRRFRIPDPRQTGAARASRGPKGLGFFPAT